MITYVQYQSSTDKGETAVGQAFNDPFALGKVDANYTGSKVVEPITSTSAAMALAWDKAVKGAFTTITVDGTEVEYQQTGVYTAAELATKAAKDVKIIAANGTVTFANLDSAGKVPSASLVTGGKVAYVYDNVVVPQNDLPRIKAEMKSIALTAKARRIAVYYSQIAAF